MEQLLKDSGYQRISACSCGGLPRRTWTHPAYPAYKIVVFMTRKTFHILHYNIDSAGGSSEHELAEWLHKIKNENK
jgi:hypothetical protein